MIGAGYVAGAYGVHGWIRIESDVSPALVGQKQWQIGGVGHGIEASRIHSGTLIAKLAGVEDRTQALALKGRQIEVPAAVLPALADGEYYWADLVGLEAVGEAGVPLGRVKALFSNGAHDLMELEGERVRLVPWISTVVKRVDLEAGRLELAWEVDW